MAWARIDDQFADHPKVVAAGPLAAWLYVCGLTYSNRLLTDGFIPAGQVRKLADVQNAPKLAATLQRVGLWESVDGGYLIHDFLVYNPSREETLAKRGELSEKRAEAGRKGAAKRWQPDGNDDSKRDGKTDGKPMANAKQIDGPIPYPYPSPTPSKGNSTSVGEIHVQTQPPPPPARTHKAVPRAVRDVVNAITQALSYDQDARLSGKEYGLLVESAEQIVGAGGTPADVPIRASRYARKYPSIGVTHGGLAGHWGELATEPIPRGSPPTNGHRPVTFDEQRELNNAKHSAEFDAILNGSKQHGPADIQGADGPPRRSLPCGDISVDAGRVLPRLPEDE